MMELSHKYDYRYFRMKKELKRILSGFTLPQEYLCVRQNEFVEPLKVFASDNSLKNKVDITSHHLLVGYKPLLIAIDSQYLNEIKINPQDGLHLSFCTEKNIKLAELSLKFIKQLDLVPVTCLIYEGVRGVHSFTNNFHKWFNYIYYQLTGDKKKNIFLDGNLYDQVKIAYSIPRLIFVASVGSNGLYNVFPTDLSGQISHANFIISLRTKGKANEQIENEGKCMVAKIDANYFSEVYNIGKNHMHDLSDINELGIRLGEESSAFFNLPVPFGAIEYFELKKIDKFEVGIHTIHFFRIINSARLSSSNSFLMHIHRDYAEWRRKNDIKTNYLIRK